MAETLLLSPFHHRSMSMTTLAGKKRGSFEEDDDDDDNEEDFMFTHNNKRSRAEFSHSSTGRNSEFFSSIYINRNFLSDKGNELVVPPHQGAGIAAALESAHKHHIEQLSKSFQSQIEQIKLQHQNEINEKNKELMQSAMLHQRLSDDCNKIHEACKSLQEESKILKRAVQIQDSKNKDLSQQLLQSEELIRQAVEHIKRVEETNRALSNELVMLQNSHHHHHYNPPDVY
jgi:hypothetical protein